MMDQGLFSLTARRFSAGLSIVALALLSCGQGFAQGSVDAGRAKAASCAACHGADGNSVNPLWPSLAGQHAAYLVRQLEAYQSGDRQDQLMTAFASTLSDEDMQDLAAYFATLPAVQRGADPSLVELGQRIYRSGLPDRGVAACIACHGPAGRGNPLAAYPVVRGQHATYLANTLNAYASGDRQSDGAVNQMMRDIAVSLRTEEIQAVASYMQGLR
ncbi:MAG TPA: c-type cytochrome [Gammaproteobacteria bacterium]